MEISKRLDGFSRDKRSVKEDPVLKTNNPIPPFCFRVLPFINFASSLEEESSDVLLARLDSISYENGRGLSDKVFLHVNTGISASLFSAVRDWVSLKFS